LLDSVLEFDTESVGLLLLRGWFVATTAAVDENDSEDEEEGAAARSEVNNHIHGPETFVVG
jgi:hypothetical protein